MEIPYGGSSRLMDVLLGCRCEAFSTYPRTYDLIHSNGVISMYQDRWMLSETMNDLWIYILLSLKKQLTLALAIYPNHRSIKYWEGSLKLYTVSCCFKKSEVQIDLFGIYIYFKLQDGN